MIIILSTIVWCLYSSIEGIREGYHFFFKNKSGLGGKDEHATFAIQRILAWIPLAYINYNPNDKFTLLNGLFLACLFMMLHDGFYYLTRNKLDNSYPLGFIDNSTTSTSVLDKKGLTHTNIRISLFIFGFLGLIIVNYVGI